MIEYSYKKIKQMNFVAGGTYHVYNRGNNRNRIFFEDENYILFVKKMRNNLLPFVNVLAWCLMPNHFHWLLRVKETYLESISDSDLSNNTSLVQPLNRSIGSILGSYTQTINKTRKRSGSLFQIRTKNKELSGRSNADDYYALTCFLYIHQNPLKAGLVGKLEDWKFSSFRDYCGIRNGTLCDKGLAADLLKFPNSADRFYEFSYETIPEPVLNKLF